MTAEVRAISALAGPEAESRVAEIGWRVPDDMGIGIGLADELTDTGAQIDTYLVYLKRVTKMTLDLPPVWRAIELLAGRLIQVGTLFWDETHPLIAMALETTPVD